MENVSFKHLENPSNVGHVQKYFVQAKTTCNFAYQFRGTINVETFINAVNLVYKHHQSFKYNLDECDDKQNLKYVRNSEKYQQDLDQQTKVLHQQITNLDEELKYLHNQSPEFLIYNKTVFLPIRFIVLTGYKENEFTIYVMYDHIVYDGTNILFQVNEIFQIYSKLLKGESVESNIQSLENRVIITDEIMLQSYYKGKIGFWQGFINTIRLLKGKLGDPGKLQWDRQEAKKIFYDPNYQEVFQRGNKRNISNFFYDDFTEIFKGVRRTHPQVSKNSILMAFWQRLFDHYNVNIRSKELSVDPESLRGIMTFPQAYKNMPYEEYAKIQGNYVAQVVHAYDTRNYDNLEDLALANHNDTQKNKRTCASVTNQMIVSPILSSPEAISGLLAQDPKHTYVTTSWTNIWLNQNVNMLEGGEFFRQTGALAHLVPENDFPNLFMSQNFVITMVGPGDEASFLYYSLNEEQNAKILEQYQIIYKQTLDYYLQQRTQQADTAQN